MKAFLLAAGTGSRLRPLTDTTPKCLLTVGGITLLDRWLDACAAAGVDEVLVNLHHLADAVRAALDGRNGRPAVRTSFEPRLLGSAGTLLANRRWVEDDEMFLACNADTLTDLDLRDLVAFHRARGHLASLAVFHTDSPSTCGIVAVDRHERVVGFWEKPTRPTGTLANAGIYAFHPSALDVLGALDRPLPLDIGYDLLPALVGRAGAMEVPGYVLDIGTPAAYQRARRRANLEGIL